MENPCCLILSCRKLKYEDMRKECWKSTVSHIADRMPVFYLFGKGREKESGEKEERERNVWIPTHPNVHTIIADCPDYYEDIPQKMYYAYRLLVNLSYSYVIKIDENTEITNVPRCLEIVEREIKHYDYIAMKGVGMKGLTEDITHLSYYHAGKVHDPRLNSLPSLLPAIEFAGGPAYAVSLKAISFLHKEYKYISLCEDYNLSAYLRYFTNINVHESDTIHESLIVDKYDEKNLYDLNSQFIRNISYKKFIDPPTPRKNCIVKVHGGLGNQMFQIATGVAYALRNDMTIKFVSDSYNHRKYYWNTLFQRFNHRLIELDDIKDANVWKEPKFSYTEIPTFTDSVFLDGYFQSSRYFPEIRGAVSAFLTFPPNFSNQISKVYNDGIFSELNVIVHARRGDYLKYPTIHSILPLSYYESAIAYMKEKVPGCRFILMSDDMEYWKSSPLFQNENVIYFNEEDITCLYVMMHTHNHIIANSTFSWWGAFLSKSKNVISPKQWFGPDGHTDTQDLYENGWIKM